MRHTTRPHAHYWNSLDGYSHYLVDINCVVSSFFITVLYYFVLIVSFIKYDKDFFGISSSQAKYAGNQNLKKRRDYCYLQLGKHAVKRNLSSAVIN